MMDEKSKRWRAMMDRLAATEGRAKIVKTEQENVWRVEIAEPRPAGNQGKRCLCCGGMVNHDH
jgi:hypothetical protein